MDDHNNERLLSLTPVKKVKFAKKERNGKLAVRVAFLKK